MAALEDMSIRMRESIKTCLVDKEFLQEMRKYCNTRSLQETEVFVTECDKLALSELAMKFNFWTPEFWTGVDEEYDRIFRIPIKIVDGVARVAFKPDDYPILVHEFVGDYSQDVLYCSYNDEDVRHHWNAGTINREIAHMLESTEGRGCGMFPDYRLRDSDYQSLLTALVKIYNLWPNQWQSHPPSSPLTQPERQVVDSFDLKAWLERHQAIETWQC